MTRLFLYAIFLLLLNVFVVTSIAKFRANHQKCAATIFDLNELVQSKNTFNLLNQHLNLTLYQKNLLPKNVQGQRRPSSSVSGGDVGGSGKVQYSCTEEWMKLTRPFFGSLTLAQEKALKTFVAERENSCTMCKRRPKRSVGSLLDKMKAGFNGAAMTVTWYAIFCCLAPFGLISELITKLEKKG
ncbi:unnamed protein product [Didymodactylos carnosus]|nr:unnamed protein product [Didymodactylos carnosus]CAF4190341.1 unnamed protein product [Didymodactylos carnosus]